MVKMPAAACQDAADGEPEKKIFSIFSNQKGEPI
jgi:hypothetical protein